jgi:hypothetical protein
LVSLGVAVSECLKKKIKKEMVEQMADWEKKHSAVNVFKGL